MNLRLKCRLCWKKLLTFDQQTKLKIRPEMNRSIIFVCVAAFCLYTIAENRQTAPYTVIANPGEQADRSIRLNWHTDPDGNTPVCLFTHRSDTDWSEACRVDAESRPCTAYDSLFSKLPNNEDWHEQARFVRNTAQNTCTGSPMIRQTKSATSRRHRHPENGLRPSYPTSMPIRRFPDALTPP